MDAMTLFTAEGTSTVPDAPAVIGGRCRNCGAVFFPFQPFGCENCGSTDLEQSCFDGSGTVLTAARVHVHADPARPPPFTVAAIVLDSGAFVRAVVEEGSAAAIAIGDRVKTTLIAATQPGGAPELQFSKADP